MQMQGIGTGQLVVLYTGHLTRCRSGASGAVTSWSAGSEKQAQLFTVCTPVNTAPVTTVL